MGRKYKKVIKPYNAATINKAVTEVTEGESIRKVINIGKGYKVVEMDTKDILNPHDEKTAEACLEKFTDNALNTTLKAHFLKAVHILYGSYYTIKKDYSKRMCFFCTACLKEMNNVKSLSEHAGSGTHIKNEDAKLQDDCLLKKDYTQQNYSKYSLNFKIKNSKIDILGCQMVEEYGGGRNRLYYKCILCGAHGKVDAMYKHLIGDKHTDKYIISRVVLTRSLITSVERGQLRKSILQNEKYSKDIRTIKDSAYYPYMWEKEGRPNKPCFKYEPPLVPPPRSIRKREVSPLKREKMRSESEDDDYKPELMRSLSPLPMEKLKIVPIRQADKTFQSYSYGFLDNILLMFNVIVQSHKLPGSEVESSDDLKVALNLLNYSLHLLHYANRGQLTDAKRGKEEIAKLKEQKKYISSCLGYVYSRMLPHYKSKHGEWSYDTQL